MYLPEDLKNYKEFNASTAIEELTGSLTRSAIFEYTQSLVAQNKKFLFGIIDIDNFKMINDNYGHTVGDEVLVQFIDAFQHELGENGLIGRYGGDEFVFVYTGPTDYDSIHDVLQSYYGYQHALRRTYCCTGVHPFVTGTIGCARFPEDAEDFNELFEKSDKALYRGKQKGRNCFIIYLHDKHKNIDITKRSEKSLTAQLSEMAEIYEKNLPTKEKFIEMINYIAQSNNFYQVLLIDNNHRMYSRHRVFMAEDISFDALRELRDETGFITVQQIETLKDVYPEFYQYCIDKNILSFVACEIVAYGKSYGFASLNDNQVARIWQEDDKVILSTLARCFAYNQAAKERNKD